MLNIENVEVFEAGAAGRGLRSTVARRAGDPIFSLTKDALLERVYGDIAEFVTALQSASDPEELLRHSVPTVHGPVFRLRLPVSLLNHANSPNASMGRPWWDMAWPTSRRDAVRLVALRDITPGEELTVDYNEAVGYDFRTDPNMDDFLELCETYDVRKSPSAFAGSTTSALF